DRPETPYDSGSSLDGHPARPEYTDYDEVTPLALRAFPPGPADEHEVTPLALTVYDPEPDATRRARARASRHSVSRRDVVRGERWEREKSNLRRRTRQTR